VTPPGEIKLNLNDLLNGLYRQFLATTSNLKTTSIGALVALGYLIMQYHHNHTITSSDIELAGGIAVLGGVSKDGTHTGAPPKDALTPKDGL